MTDIPDTLNAALADRYRLDRQLGAGGMATVYLAHDLRHDRPVAFKVLHPQLAATLGPGRFQREIKLAARLQHPHILTVFDSGEAAGQLWFTMPFVEGESLRDRLIREKQLPLEDAVRITREVADALEYAHRHGVVHRDIKPENILLSGSHALVADFGIARALSGEGDSLTQTGMAIGTPAYMSPEQANGERELDARTDVYALGCVLYEMLAGEPPFTGPNAQAIISKRMATPAPSISVVRDGTPLEVSQALARALSRAPADRFSTAAEFAKALGARSGEQYVTPVVTAAVTTAVQAPKRRMPLAIAAGAGVLVLVLGGLFAWRRSPAPAAESASASGPRLLAVLPFENLGAPDDEYFADGITDEVRGKLTALPGLRVTARSSASQYKKTTKSPQQIGQELGVQYLLTGTVRWEKGSGQVSRVKVSPELIDASTASSKWQQPFDAELSDVFKVQADIAGRVAQALDVALGAGEQQQLAEKPTQNLGAYEAFLRGEALFAGGAASDPGSLRRAITYYGQAVALDPTFFQAWAQLSRTHSRLYFVGTPTPADAEQARQTAERAIALAPERQEGRLAMGDYLQSVQGDPVRAHEQYVLCQRIAPGNADVLTAATLNEQSLGRWETALDHIQQAQRLDPRSLQTTRRLGFTLLRLHRYPEAIQAFDRGLALAPASLNLLEEKAMVYLAQGDLAGARAVLRGAPKEVDPMALVSYIGNFWDLVWLLDEEQQALMMRLTPSAFDDDPATWGFVLAETAALRGDQAGTRKYAEAARTALEEQLRVTPNNAQLHVALGLMLAYLGRSVDAAREGERGMALAPVAKDGYSGPYLQHVAVRIYTVVGNKERAIDLLEPLLKLPYYLSPAWLRIDPNFEPLRSNPRFQKLVAGS